MKTIEILITVLFLLTGFAVGENIDPYSDGSQYAWCENVGWLNFKSNQEPGVHVTSDKVEGFVWSENIGWINLSPVNYGGIANDGVGNLSGFAWGENVGWINFGPSYGGVTIDPLGRFEGLAWGENIGWIRFDSRKSYNVRTCVVTLDDLANFADTWLGVEPGGADFANFGVLADYWQDYCPEGWQFK